MMDKSNVLVVWIPNDQIGDDRAYRDYILESLRTGVLILPADVTCEVMELPELGAVEVKPVLDAEPDTAPASLPEGEEKRAIIRRLKKYRATQGLGSLEALAAKTAHQKGKRISAETLRYICGDGAPKMPLEDWQKIAKALDTLEQKS